MSRIDSARLVLCWGCFLGGVFAALPAAHADEGKPKDLPRGAEKAVAAVRAAFPKATIDGAVEPKGFGGSGGKGTPLFWAVRVSNGGKTTRLVVSPDGKSARETKVQAEKKAARPAKELEIPAKAARAVAAVKALYPEAVVKQITHEVFDDGTGDLEILTYEVEFVTKGVERELVASPGGVIPHLWVPVEAKDLPKAVTEAVGKAAPGGRVEKARAFEIRASLRFAALEKAKVYYTVQVEKGGTTRTLKLKPDGGVINKFGFPKKK
jgi:hypothetical protein